MTNNSFSPILREVKAIISAGQQAALERLPELLTWLSNTNGPGFPEIADFIHSLGHVVVPHVKAALGKMDDLGEWQSAILSTQVKHWPREWVIEIEDELEELVWYGSERWGIDEDAALILAENRLGNQKQLLMVVANKKRGCLSRLKRLEAIEQKLGPVLSSDDGSSEPKTI